MNSFGNNTGTDYIENLDSNEYTKRAHRKKVARRIAVLVLLVAILFGIAIGYIKNYKNTFLFDDISWDITPEELKSSFKGKLKDESGEFIFYSYKKIENIRDYKNISVCYKFSGNKLDFIEIIGKGDPIDVVNGLGAIAVTKGVKAGESVYYAKHSNGEIYISRNLNALMIRIEPFKGKYYPGTKIPTYEYAAEMPTDNIPDLTDGACFTYTLWDYEVKDYIFVLVEDGWDMLTDYGVLFDPRVKEGSVTAEFQKGKDFIFIEIDRDNKVVNITHSTK